MLTTEAATESIFSRFYFYICKKQGCFCFCFTTIIVKCLQESSSVFSAERVFDVQHGTQMFFPFPKDKRAGQWKSQVKKLASYHLVFLGQTNTWKMLIVLFDSLCIICITFSYLRWSYFLVIWRTLGFLFYISLLCWARPWLINMINKQGKCIHSKHSFKPTDIHWDQEQCIYSHQNALH